MSFQQMKVDELRAAAAFWDILLEPGEGKKEIILKLQEEGKTYAEYKKFHPDPEDESEETSNVPFAPQSTMLIKMVRPNGTFEAYGYRFTRDHPYVVVPAEDGQKIIGSFEGFVIATPDEVKSFYS